MGLLRTARIQGQELGYSLTVVPCLLPTSLGWPEHGSAHPPPHYVSHPPQAAVAELSWCTKSVGQH